MQNKKGTEQVSAVNVSPKVTFGNIHDIQGMCVQRQCF